MRTIYKRAVRYAAVAISRAVSAEPHDGRSFAGKEFVENKYSISVTALNVANRRVQLNISLTFGDFIGTSRGRGIGIFIIKKCSFGWPSGV
jgi:hypothetical protein